MTQSELHSDMQINNNINLNRFIVCKSSYCPNGLTPRCRLISSSRCSSLEGFSCSLNKEVRELGLIRRESVQILSSEGNKNERKTSNQYERTIRDNSMVSLLLKFLQIVAQQSSYNYNREVLKASQVRNRFLDILVIKRITFLYEIRNRLFLKIGHKCVV